jgi:putative membrane protein
VLLTGRALPHIWPRVLTVTAVSFLDTWLYRNVDGMHVTLTQTPFVLLGLPLGIFLGFRNSAAYDRFWEGRKLWGSLVNTARSISRQALTLLGEPVTDSQQAEQVRALQVRFVHSTIAFVHALRIHLREEPTDELLALALETDAPKRLCKEPNVPLALLQELGELLREARVKRFIDPLHVAVIEGSLTQLTDVQGACERIKSTPVPFSYTVLMHRIVGVYCLLLPFGLPDTLGWGAPLVGTFVAYALFGLDAIGEEIEQPFGRDSNDLPLATISRSIEISLRALLGERPLPEPLRAVRGIQR